MPNLPPRPCTKARCTKYATKNSRCAEHQHKAWNHEVKSRHERGYGNDWDKVRKNALLRDDYICQDCKDEGIYTRGEEVDHIKPKYLGGTNDLSNLRTLCKPHHKQKSLQESIASRNHKSK